jgi:CRISPR-associated protein Cmr1
MRSIAGFPTFIPSPALTGVTKEYRLETITPAFGAGVETRIPDESTPVRGTSVRGHLRFWWRATRGRQFKNFEQLRREEFRIWGDTESPSKIDVEVFDSAGQKANSETLLGQNRDLVYVLFPFAAMGAAPAADYWASLTFGLRLRYPENLRKDVEAALWAWTNFGGIGSRTRRGCGALYCREFAPALATGITQWVQERLYSYVDYTDSESRDWPTVLYPPLVNATRSGDAFSAWTSVIRLMAEFRQFPPVGRRGTPGAPRTFSRSYWPEADSLRAISGRGIPDHMESLTATEAFPRAELGLPYLIKFHSRTRSTLDGANDCTVLPLDSESTRTASPVILRPLAYGDGKRAMPTVHLISRYTLPGVRIAFEDRRLGEISKPSGAVARPDLAMYPGSPLNRSLDGSPNGSAVESFLAFAQEKGYKS